MAFDRKAYAQAYNKRIHGVVWFARRYLKQGIGTAKDFKNLPVRLPREEAMKFYKDRLNKVWKGLGYVY